MLPSRRDVESVSGYLSFDVGNQSEATINLRSVDNSVPEPNKVFTVKLLDCSGPSGVSKAEDVAILTSMSGTFILFPFQFVCLLMEVSLERWLIFLLTYKI